MRDHLTPEHEEPGYSPEQLLRYHVILLLHHAIALVGLLDRQRRLNFLHDPLRAVMEAVTCVPAGSAIAAVSTNPQHYQDTAGQLSQAQQTLLDTTPPWGLEPAMTRLSSATRECSIIAALLHEHPSLTTAPTHPRPNRTHQSRP